jgi:hypothetical protein
MAKGGFDRNDIVKNETTRLWDVTVDFLGERTLVGSYGFLDEAIRMHKKSKKKASVAAKEQALKIAFEKSASDHVAAYLKTIPKNRILTLTKKNKSGAVGVTYSENRQRWRASINVNGQRIHLGFFEEKERAIAAREAANRKYGFVNISELTGET